MDVKALCKKKTDQLEYVDLENVDKDELDTIKIKFEVYG